MQNIAISNLQDATQAIATHGTNICLMSPVGGGASLGAVYWKRLLDSVDKNITSVLHCGDNVGAVQLAIVQNVPTVLYIGKHDVGHMQNDITKILTKHPFYD